MREVTAWFGDKKYELDEGICTCEKVAMKNIVYVEAFSTWGIPMHTICKRLLMNPQGYNSLTETKKKEEE